MDGGAHPVAQRSQKPLAREARSVIVLGQNYGPKDDPLKILEHKDRAAISSYAQGDDYHDVVKKKKLKVLAGYIFQTFKCEVKAFVDTAPVMEKPLAQKAGLGWQGKHTNLVSRDFGSWLFLGSIFTTLELPPGRARDRSLRHLSRLSGYLSHQRLSRALPAGCAALHLLSHHREQRSDPPGIPCAHGQPHLWLRRLPGGVPLEQVRHRSGGDQTGGARRSPGPVRSGAAG